MNVINVFKEVEVPKNKKTVIMMMLTPVLILVIVAILLLFFPFVFYGLSMEFIKLLATQIVFFVIIGAALITFVRSIDTAITVYLSFIFFNIASKGQLISLLNPFLFHIEVFVAEYVYNSFNFIVFSVLTLYLIYIKKIN